jgi:hypothetical protein
MRTILGHSVSKRGTSLARPDKEEASIRRSDIERVSSCGDSGDAAPTLANSTGHMMKLPLRMTGAIWDFMMQGMRTSPARDGSREPPKRTRR